MKHTFFTFLLLSACLTASASIFRSSSHTLDSLLEVYDHDVEQADYYLSLRQAKIDSLKLLLQRTPSSHALAYAIGELYAPYQCDSTEKYFRLAIARAPLPTPREYTNALVHTLERISGENTVYNNEVDTVVENEYADIDSVDVIPPYYDHEYAIKAYFMSDHCKQIGDKQGQMEWLTRSAIADVRCGVCDNASSWMLAEELYAMGQLERATRYIEYSTRNADTFHARQRYVQVTPLATLITGAYRTRLKTNTRYLTAAVILAGVALVLLAISGISVTRKNKRLRAINHELRRTNKMLDRANHSLDAANRQLAEMNRIREQYICTYLEEKSEAIRKNHRQARLAGALDSDEKMKQQLDKFYHQFDTTFLRLFPDFVEQVNALLEYEGQVHPPKGELTPELRIFALIRMGITRSTRIAELLCYSNNTIYNYRARLKTYAIHGRDNFEDEIRAIR